VEGTAVYAPVLTYIAEVAPDREFTLVDIGCSGGIDPVWRRFGRRLRALAIDPNVEEIERLRSGETHRGIRYVSGFAGLPAEHPFARQKHGQSDWGRNPWDRLSAAKSLEIMKSRTLSRSEMMAANLWPEMELADSSRLIVVPEYLLDNSVRSVDFVKIDIDGRDFDVLNSFDSALDSLGILGFGLEVNYHGSVSETDHTFHNTDRFMKARGFELFNLTVRRYSLATLPSKYLFDVPAQTEFGRPLQGDALYLRDLGSPEYQEIAVTLEPAKVLNLVCLFSAFNLPDCAAEIALHFRQRLSPLCDVDHVLDLLTEQAQGAAEKPLSYREYMERFEAQDALFFPAGSSRSSRRDAGVWTSRTAGLQAEVRTLIPGWLLPTLRRLRRAWRVLRQP
jgi:hypothetical protein